MGSLEKCYSDIMLGFVGGFDVGDEGVKIDFLYIEFFYYFGICNCDVLVKRY